MRFFKRIAGILGLGKDEAHQVKDQEEAEEGDNEDSADEIVRNIRGNIEPIPSGPRRGFSVPVQVAVERPSLGPVLVPCNGDGGVQGLRWYARRLRVDEDGDIADEFIDQVSEDVTASALPSCGQDHLSHPPPIQQPVARFQVKYGGRPAKVRNQVMSIDGKFQQCVESQGRLQWV